MLNRKTAAKAASSIFYEDYNDVDIYIEDTAVGYRKIFKEIISQALGGEFTIEQVFPIGSRTQVINECRANQSKSGRKKLFIIDGDLYMLSDESPEDLNGLYALPRYCIENYLISEEAIIKIAYEEDSEMEVEKIKEGLAFNEWLSHNDILIELFILYAICFKYLPSQQTVGFKVNHLCSSNSGIVCPTKIEARKLEIYNKILGVISEEQLNFEIDIRKERIKEHDHKILRFISGKDYLLPLLITRLQSFLKFPAITIPIKVRLAMKADMTELSDIKDFIFE